MRDEGREMRAEGREAREELTHPSPLFPRSCLYYFRPVISEVVTEYLKCGDLKEGFARVCCQNCGHSYILAFSCKGRWFCPSCHAKKVIQFADQIKENILYPVPHRQYVFSIPIILRIYFKHNPKMLTKLCHCAYESLLEFFRTTIGLSDGVPGLVMTIHTFLPGGRQVATTWKSFILISMP